jgi:hypothetical protein
MGCHVCGRRQVDPESGPSAWRRAVVAGEQVLVCPECQVDGWTDGLDRCRACGSTALVKRLGEVSCRGCGAAGERAWSSSAVIAPVLPAVSGRGGGGTSREQLAADVEAALERVLRGGASGSGQRRASVLRRMTVADLEALMVVQREGAVLALAAIFPQDDYPFPTDVVRRRWEVELADPDIDSFAVVDPAGTLTGFVAVRGDHFLHFGTAVHTWGSGLAGRAYDDVRELWVSRGVTSAWLRLFEANDRARRFYERRGWVATGESSTSDFVPNPVLLTYTIDLTRP